MTFLKKVALTVLLSFASLGFAQNGANCPPEIAPGSYSAEYLEGSLKALQVGTYYNQERPRLIRQLDKEGIEGEAFIEQIELTSLKVLALEKKQQLEFFDRASRCLLRQELLSRDEAQSLTSLFETFLRQDNASSIRAMKQFEEVAVSPLAKGMLQDLKALYESEEGGSVTQASVAKGVGYLTGAVVGAISNAVNGAAQTVKKAVSETTKAVTQAANDFADGYQEGLNDSQDGGDDGGGEGGDSSGGGNDCGC